LSLSVCISVSVSKEILQATWSSAVSVYQCACRHGGPAGGPQQAVLPTITMQRCAESVTYCTTAR